MMDKTELNAKAAALATARNKIAALGDALPAYIAELEAKAACPHGAAAAGDLERVQAELARTKGDLSIANATAIDLKAALKTAEKNLADAERRAEILEAKLSTHEAHKEPTKTSRRRD